MGSDPPAAPGSGPRLAEWRQEMFFFRMSAVPSGDGVFGILDAACVMFCKPYWKRYEHTHDQT